MDEDKKSDRLNIFALSQYEEDLKEELDQEMDAYIEFKVAHNAAVELLKERDYSKLLEFFRDLDQKGLVSDEDYAELTVEDEPERQKEGAQEAVDDLYSRVCEYDQGMKALAINYTIAKCNWAIARSEFFDKYGHPHNMGE